ncbi:hypothetical protein C2845_PM16G02110 [Panicum miliaceum]|uniref:Uncharacterized protein n=1 Tax=Panicum miliaceum TaxID=4540 RepID=A0A3L6PVX1_PANMI|nr:hypothetical protein C2845_PM16G02110 [Panicum miliaceum]
MAGSTRGGKNHPPSSSSGSSCSPSSSEEASSLAPTEDQIDPFECCSANSCSCCIFYKQCWWRSTGAARISGGSSRASSASQLRDGMEDSSWGGVVNESLGNCRHGLHPCRLYTWDGKHTVRRYLGCNLENKSERCDYVQWIEEPWPTRAQEVILTLWDMVTQYMEMANRHMVVERELIAGGAVGFHFFALLLPGNDDIAGVPTSVDDGAKVARGGVMEVAAPLLIRLDRAMLALGALCIDEPTVFLLDVICVFCLDAGWGYTVHCCVHVFVEWIKEVVVVVV